MVRKQDKYDVVVLGSGIGGLSTAALLAKKGYKTLVAEKLGIIGGRCATLDYKGFKVPTGVVGVPMLGTLKSIFDDVGAEFNVTPVTIPPKFQTDKALFDFPSSRDPLDLLPQMGASEKELARLRSAIKKAENWSAPANETTLREFLQHYTANENVIGFFSNKADRFISSGASEISAREYFLSHTGCLRDFAGTGIAPKGSGVLMKELKKSIEENGGKVITQCKAKQILVRDGVVEGVVLEGKRGESTVAASAVVSNAGPDKTISLVGKEHFDAGYLQNVGNMVPSLQIWVTTTSDRPLFEVPLLMTLNTRRMLAFMSVSLMCPELAPKGKYVHYSISGPVSQVGPWNIRNEVNLHIQDLKERIPDFNNHGEVLHVGCYQGAWPTLRNTPIVGYHDIPQKTPVENLYNVGDGVAKSGGWAGGSPGTALTARVVVDEIVNRLRPG